MTLLLRLKKISLVVLIAILLVSCVNEDEQLGLNLVKSDGGLDVFKTEGVNVSINTEIFKEDTLSIYNYDNLMLGSLKDEYFGKTSTSIYLSLSLQNNECNFTTMNIDSVVLCLAYSGAFVLDSSVKSCQMNINVWELDKQIDEEKKYINSEIEVSDKIFTNTLNINPSDAVVLDNDTIVPHLRMKLSNSFVDKLKNGIYPDNSSFANDFKGLKITGDCEQDKMLAYINTKSSYSGIFVYYHNNEGRKGTYIIHFPASKKFMNVSNDYTSTTISDLNNQTSIVSNDYIYLSCLGISCAKIDILNLNDWYNLDDIKGAVLNRAELILPVSNLIKDSYLYPPSLMCFRKDGEKYFLLKDEININNWLGNKYDASINAYRIDVTSFLQNYLLGKYTDCTLYVFPESRHSTACRVILNGKDYVNENLRPKLNVIYSHSTN